jgi:hypothetical protein
MFQTYTSHAQSRLFCYLLIILVLLYLVHLIAPMFTFFNAYIGSLPTKPDPWIFLFHFPKLTSFTGVPQKTNCQDASFLSSYGTPSYTPQSLSICLTTGCKTTTPHTNTSPRDLALPNTHESKSEDSQTLAKNLTPMPIATSHKSSSGLLSYMDLRFLCPLDAH